MVALVASPLVRTASAAAPAAVRYNATSTEGKAMLVKYAKAVDIMKNQMPATDPRNWNFQWFTHWVPGPDPRTPTGWEGSASIKKAFLDQTFGTKASPERQLAEEMWNACQTHGIDPTNPHAFMITYFLPWHRWYVYYFEQIVQNVLQDPSFTLPYWDYLGTDPKAKCIPVEFTDKNSPLYVGMRNSWVNEGQPIDIQNPGTLNFNASLFSYYVDETGATGFCPTLNNNPHGLVHDYTGDDNDMGYVPTAAQDPIFWLHHCNIDRLWASWNKAGYSNPTWDDRLFTLADGSGKRVQVNLNGASSIAQLNYDYDGFQPVVKPVTAVRANAVAAKPAASKSGPVQLSGKAPVPVTLQPLEASQPRLLSAAPNGASAVFLVLSGFEVGAPMNGTYNVFLNLPEGTPPSTSSPYYVGTFGSFELMGSGHDGHGAGGSSIAFDASAAVAHLSTSGSLPAPKVTFVPVGSIRVAPSVASVSLVSN